MKLSTTKLAKLKCRGACKLKSGYLFNVEQFRMHKNDEYASFKLHIRNEEGTVHKELHVNTAGYYTGNAGEAWHSKDKQNLLKEHIEYALKHAPSANDMFTRQFGLSN